MGSCRVVAAVLTGESLPVDKSDGDELLGGTLRILWDRESDLVYMTGPATVVYEGEIDFSQFLAVQ